jgi:type II secretory pathway pseudopilin PulG
MLIVVTIIGILASIVLPRFIATSSAADRAAHKADRGNLNKQLESYYFNTGSFAVSGNLETWTSGYELYFPEGLPATCNKDVKWSISNGRVLLDGHGGHE